MMSRAMSAPISAEVRTLSKQSYFSSTAAGGVRSKGAVELCGLSPPRVSKKTGEDADMSISSPAQPPTLTQTR